jgi:putative intracellular protease/amidase
MRSVLRFCGYFLAVVLALAALPVSVGIAVAAANARSVYAPAPSSGVAAPSARPFDPALPTAVVVLGAEGANAADALGPFEVLAVTGRFNVLTAAPTAAPVTLTGGLDLVPDVTFESLATRLGGRAADVVVVPAMPRTDEPPVLDFVRRQAGGGALVLSVCWGGGVAAASGVLDGHTATSHWYRLDGLERDFPAVRWQRGVRYVDDGPVISTAGVLSGIDGPVFAASAEARGNRPVSTTTRSGRSSVPDRYVWGGTVVPAASAGGSDRSTDDARAAVVAANGARAEVTAARLSSATDRESGPRTVTV